MCTGSFVLASTGLLDGKIATTNWLFMKKFHRLFSKVILKPERILTEDDGLICSGAMTAMYNLALYVIEIFASDELSRRCSKIMLVDHIRKSQLPYMETTFRKNHGLFLRQDQNLIIRPVKSNKYHFIPNMIICFLDEDAGCNGRNLP